MRVPLSWLAEYVDVPGDATPESVMAELVKVGLEEEGSHGFGVTGPLVVGEVLEFVEEPQTNGKTIRWCQIRVAAAGQKAADGGEDVRGIVCGASSGNANLTPSNSFSVGLRFFNKLENFTYHKRASHIESVLSFFF